ncbi:hypothetical protein GOP47_0025332 [Adiantum capillus-veneris]|uniref:Uncharacterized protein n=1 Tax=Adiantum capillus-veneris TaxID=13818 RepID=A0A9D4U142_ADICA|nr:hypothetical protein GOP47_0025332 [Adiantum capillus-veneris]
MEKSPEEIHADELIVDSNACVENRQTKTGRWKAAKYIIGNQGLSCLGFYGAIINLVVYFTDVLHQGNATAANNVSTWAGTASLFPVVGAFVADAYWGRYRTCVALSCVSVVGMGLMVLSAALPTLKPPPCPESSLTTGKCKKATSLQMSFFFMALYVMSFGAAAYMPCLTAMGADQFDEEVDEEKQQKSSFFNWFYLSVNVGALFSSTLLVYMEQTISWWLVFAICTGSVLASVLILISGSRMYRLKESGGNPFPRLLQVLVASARKWKVKVSSDYSTVSYHVGNRLYEVSERCSTIKGSRKVAHTNVYRFLDKAATETEGERKTREKGQMISPWQLCTVTQVEEVKFLLRLFPVWVTSILFSTVYVQMSTLFVEQGNLMNTQAGSLNIPAAAVSTFDTISVILWVPIYDRVIVRVAKHWTGHSRGLTSLQRIGAGLAISILSMIAAALIEINRLRIAEEEGVMATGEAVKSMSVFWQVPQYAIVGAAEVFTYIGQMELFYDESPDALRSLSIALMGVGSALGNYISTLLVVVVNKITSSHGNREPWIPEENLNLGHMDRFFWLLASISATNLVLFIWFSRRYQYTVHLP